LKKQDKELLEIIDRLAAGEDVFLPSDTSDEMKEKVKAARELFACTAEPSPCFQENLRRRVVNLLEARQAETIKESRHWWKGLSGFFLIPSVWRTAAVAVTVGALALLAVWAAGLLPFQSPDVPPVVGTALPAAVQVETAAPGVVSAQQGMEVRVELLFRNTVSGEVNIKPFPPEIYIMQPLSRTPVRVFPAGEGEFTLLPSGKAAYTLIWDQRDDSGLPVPAGTYMVSVVGISAAQSGAPQPTVFDAPNVAQIDIQAS
jgi:hypothetical protein